MLDFIYIYTSHDSNSRQRSNKNRLVFRRLPTPNGQWIQTEGINPFHQYEETIRNIIQSTTPPHSLPVLTQIHSIFFYGAGCTPSLAGISAATGALIFPQTALLSRPICLERHAPSAKTRLGIACILGTGSKLLPLRRQSDYT